MLAAGRTAEDINAEMRSKKIVLSHLDGISSWAPIWYASDAGDFVRWLFHFDPVHALDLGAAFGVEAVVAAGLFAEGEVAPDDLIRSFADFCDLAAKRNIRVDLEFVTQSGISTLQQALSIVQEANRPNSGVLVDTWHLIRCSRDFGEELALLASLPRGYVENIQINDGLMMPKSAEGGAELFNRDFPGKGEFPIADIIQAANASGGVKWIGVEVFGPALGELSEDEVGVQTRAALSSYLLKF